MLESALSNEKGRGLVGWKKGKRSVARQDATSLGSHKPLARSEDLIVEELGDEVLVYDSNSDTAHCLSPDAARVWGLCDGGTSIESLTAQVSLTAERVENALVELERCELLEARPTLTGDGHTRRELGLKVAQVGAAAAAVPLIVSVAAPTPAMAVTPAFCFERSSGNCGTQTGCTKEVGCCCCTPPLHAPYAPGSPCDTCTAEDGNCGEQCKTCVPCDRDDEFCPQFGHTGECSAGDAC
jgi:hypothetical protein